MILKRFFFVLTALLLVFQIKAQQVNENFSVQVFADDFSAETNQWDYLTTAENLFVLDKGEYFMHRRNETKPYALVTNWKNDLTVFQVKAALKLGPATSPEQTIGIIFYIQSDGKGALVFEINKDKKFRVKQLAGAYYKFLTGEVTDAGWVKSKFIDVSGLYNLLEAKSSAGVTDFYINGNYVSTTTVQDYAPGAMGILIGPDTKAKADYFQVYATRAVSDDVNANRQFGELTPNEKIEFLLAENDKLKRQITQDNVEQIKQQADLKVSTMQEQVKNREAEIEQLTIEVNSLRTYKNDVIKEMDEDVFLTLSNSVKEQVEVNKKLNKFIEEIRDSLTASNKRYQDLKLKQVNDLIEQQKKIQAKKESVAATKEVQKAETAKVVAKKEEAVKISDQPKIVVSENKVEAKPLPVKTRTAIKKG
jgi:phage host-nuclease inhibitor protein Gam